MRAGAGICRLPVSTGISPAAQTVGQTSPSSFPSAAKRNVEVRLQFQPLRLWIVRLVLHHLAPLLKQLLHAGDSILNSSSAGLVRIRILR